MYVLNEDEYREFKRYKSSLPAPEPAPGVKCPICGKEFDNENILAHHLKSHVDGFKCNICGKVFKHKRNLAIHLKAHPLQVQESKYSVLDSNMPTAVPQPNTAVPTAVHTAVPQPPTAVPRPPTAVPTAVRKKKHKRKSVLNFETKQWLTLK